MSTALAALVAAASIGLTYLCCVRPMRRGGRGCGMPGSGRQHEPAAGDARIAELREELRLLQARRVPPPGGWSGPTAN